MINWKKISKVQDVPLDVEVVFYCPKEEPVYVLGYRREVAGYVFLAYADENLRDVSPEGPAATHYALASEVFPTVPV